VPTLADWLGRRFTLGIFYTVMMVSLWVGFGQVFYFETHAVSAGAKMRIMPVEK
jgi:hypothetical protein